MLKIDLSKRKKKDLVYASAGEPGLSVLAGNLVNPAYRFGLAYWKECPSSELATAISAYFQDVLDRRARDEQYDNRGIRVSVRYPFTHSGLVNHLGLRNKGELVLLQKENDKHGHVMSQAFMIIEQDIVEGTLLRVYGDKMSSMYLTQCLSWLASGNKTKERASVEVGNSARVIQYVQINDREDLKKLSAPHERVLDVSPLDEE